MRWTNKDIEVLSELIISGKNYKEISDIIYRSETSIRNKANEIGIITSMYHKPVYKTYSCLECDEVIISLENRKFCSHSCSAKFNNRLSYKKEEKFCIYCKSSISKRSKFCSHLCNRLYNKKLFSDRLENGDTKISDRQCKKFLIEKYGEKCMECGWNKRHEITNNVPIQLEHIDGHSENNRLDNLKLLCPNCHSLTKTFGSLNKGNGRKRY